MFIALGLGLIGLGVHLARTHTEVIGMIGPVHLTWYHLCFAVGLLSLIRGIWKWVTS